MEYRLVLIALICTMLLFGCTNEGQQNGGENESNQTTNGNTGVQPELNQSQGNETGEQNQTDEQEEQNQTGEEQGFDLNEMLGKALSASYTVDYRIQSTGTSGTIGMDETDYIKRAQTQADTKIRIDTQTYSESGNPTMMTSVFSMDGKIYMCTNYNSMWTCMELQQSLGDVGGTETLQNAEEHGYTLTPTAPRVILGETTSCMIITITSPPQSQSEMCYTTDGILLYMHTTSAEVTYTKEATQFSRTVSDSDFELPAEPTTIPGYPG